MKKLISWNVNGLRACVGKGFLDIFKELDADIFCIQESKLQGGQIDLELDGYYQYWSYAEKKGYSGTALFTKEEPLSVTWELKPMITRGVSSRLNFWIIMLSHATRQTLRTGWQDCLTGCSGRMIFSPI